MDNLNQGNESDAIREKANILNDKIVQNTETSVTGGGHLPPTRKKREKRQTRVMFEEAVARSRMTADEYRASLVAEAESKAREEARIAAEAKAKEEADAFEALKRQAEAEAKAQAEEIEKLKAQAEADAAAREEELARARAQYEEDFRRQAEEIARQAREEAQTTVSEEREGAIESEEVLNNFDRFESDDKSFETEDGFTDNQEDTSASVAPSYDLIETEALNESAVGSDKTSDASVFEQESEVFEEKTPVFNEESPVFEEETPVFNEEPPVFDDVQTVSEGESFFEETMIFEEQDSDQRINADPSDVDIQVASQSESAETDAESEPDDFGFAIDTMTKSDAAAELKYDHAAYRTRRKPVDSAKTTDIPWVIPGNVQESEPLEEAPEITPEPQETVQEELHAIAEMPVIEETRSEREERDVLAVLDEYDKTGEPDVKRQTLSDDEFDRLESETPFSETDDSTLHHTADTSSKTDVNVDFDEELFTSEDLNDNAVSANTLFDVEEIAEVSPAANDTKNDTAFAEDLSHFETVETASNHSSSAMSKDGVDDDLFEEMAEIPESNDDLFESESIDETDNKQPVTEKTVSVDPFRETKKESDTHDITSSGAGEKFGSDSIESFDNLFEEESVADMPADASDRFDTKPIAYKSDTAFSEESISEKQDVVPSEEPKSKDSSIQMLDELFDLDDHIADQTPVTEQKETSEINLEEIKPHKKKSDDDFDLEMLDINSMNAKYSVASEAADIDSSSKTTTKKDLDKSDAVELNSSDSPKKSTVNINQIDSDDDLFSVEDVPEKAEATVKTVTEKIVPANASNADSLFESEIISPDSRTAPLPNLDPEATTPLEKQDMSAQSKVSKAYDALFEEDES